MLYEKMYNYQAVELYCLDTLCPMQTRRPTWQRCGRLQA